MIGNDTVAYRRQLPHLSKDHKTYFVTFVSMSRSILGSRARDIVLRSCLHDHRKRCWVHCVIVMPDHVHMLLSPFEGVSLTALIAAVKSSSAHLVNKALGSRGPLWQSESFDHILRSDESVLQKANYILENPVRKKLVMSALDWPWYWSAYLQSGDRETPVSD
jgi:REP element-mobilizing transposase RayT